MPPPVLFSADLSGCDALAALSPDDIISRFTAALVKAGANVVSASSHVFPGAGLTAVLILRESHAVIHTWPETGTVNLDIFSCTSRLKAMDAVDELSRVLRAGSVAVQKTPRADGHGPEATRLALTSRQGEASGPVTGLDSLLLFSSCTPLCSTAR